MANTRDKVFGFIEQSWKVQSPCFRIYYMHDLLCVLKFYQNTDIHGPNLTKYSSLLNAVLKLGICCYERRNFLMSEVL